jgi:hypothetical protein
MDCHDETRLPDFDPHIKRKTSYTTCIIGREQDTPTDEQDTYSDEQDTQRAEKDTPVPTVDLRPVRDAAHLGV